MTVTLERSDRSSDSPTMTKQFPQLVERAIQFFLCLLMPPFTIPSHLVDELYLL